VALYDAVPDYYFATPTTTRYVVCESLGCRTVAQDPVPDPETVASFYAGYYTHRAPSIGDRIRRELRTRRLARRLRGAVAGPAPQRELDDADELLDIGGVIPDRSWSTLEVGCGRGERVLTMARLGFGDVRGVDNDPEAVAAACAIGARVTVGTAERLAFPDASFDFVLLNHVIEHSARPRAALAEIARVLRPGGWVALVTPSAVSRMHERHGMYWRALEAPRHVFVYTAPSLARIVASAGLEVARVGTSTRITEWIDRVSAEQRRGGPVGPFFAFAETMSRGEEALVIARKPSTG
jgi:ubiquinone/menaquinone biosynthesis C-methylase UbiE